MSIRVVCRHCKQLQNFVVKRDYTICKCCLQEWFRPRPICCVCQKPYFNDETD